MADARFDEVVERLLFLLEHPSQNLVKKWGQTGLLEGLPDFVQETLAEWLEEETLKIIDAKALGDEISDDTIVERFHALRQKAFKEYEWVQDVVRQSVREGKPIDHYVSLYHNHGFS